MNENTPVADGGKKFIPPLSDHHYDALLSDIAQQLMTLPDETPLFETDVQGLFDTFLDALPATARQQYNCNACRRFVDNFGGLVTIDEHGMTRSLFWAPDHMPFFQGAVTRMREKVQSAKVTGVFITSEWMWGTPKTGPWCHIAAQPNRSRLYIGTQVKDAHQRACELREDYKTVLGGLKDFSLETVEQAVTLLKAEALYGGMRTLGPATWLLNLHRARRDAIGKRQQENVTWLAIAKAPPGWAHVRSSMIGTLLEDLVAGRDMESIKRRFAEKMDPLTYQRAQAAPKAGNIAQAEKVVAALATEGALKRRYARFEEIDAFWRPGAIKEKPKAGGVFGHLKEQPKKVEVDPPVGPVLTWEKFKRTVLPEAAQIELYTDARRRSYTAIVTAANPEAPPILQWDGISTTGKRNPFSWYCYDGGSLPSRWNLPTYAWVPVVALTENPAYWWDADREKLKHEAQRTMLILEGARDLNYQNGGLFFPSMLRSEYHSVRATMEHFAKTGVIEGLEESTACGLPLSQGAADWNVRLRVTTRDGQVMIHPLDRWD